MGRRTWESLPERFRPLPGRTNVVLTTDPLWWAEGARPAYSVDQVLSQYPDCWVIGGGTVYAEFLPHAERAVVTEVDLAVEGDTRAPVLGTGWRVVSRTPGRGLGDVAVHRAALRGVGPPALTGPARRVTRTPLGRFSP